jgi:hypothetical protein
LSREITRAIKLLELIKNCHEKTPQEIKINWNIDEYVNPDLLAQARDLPKSTDKTDEKKKKD